MQKLLLWLLFLLSIFFYADVHAQMPASQLLTLAESGKADSVKSILQGLLRSYPDNAEYLFVDAVITEDGNAAFTKFGSIVKNYPASKYADAAQYRIYQYYFALGAYKKADSTQAVLKKNYPKSPYVPYANGTVEMAEKKELTVDTPAEIGPSGKFGSKPEGKPMGKNKVKQIAVKPEPAKAAWLVQAGAFIQKGNAEALKKQLSQTGLTFRIKEKQAAGATLFVVSSAANSEENARAIAVKLDTEFKIKARVIRNEAEKP
ncbi:MAG: SPOR domain-containing protein [Ignavibacteriales bacterium]|nr:SPOR domain-containing protein [Ignavibacteriales bacterium]